MQGALFGKHLPRADESGKLSMPTCAGLLSLTLHSCTAEMLSDSRYSLLLPDGSLFNCATIFSMHLVLEKLGFPSCHCSPLRGRYRYCKTAVHITTYRNSGNHMILDANLLESRMLHDSGCPDHGGAVRAAM